VPGPAGADGLGVPPGGDTGTVLTKVSPADNDTTWAVPTGGGGGMPPPTVNTWYSFAPYWPGQVVTHEGSLWLCNGENADDLPVVGAARAPGVDPAWEPYPWDLGAYDAALAREFVSGLMGNNMRYWSGPVVSRGDTNTVPPGTTSDGITVLYTDGFSYSMWMTRTPGVTYASVWPPTEGPNWKRLDMLGLSERLDTLEGIAVAARDALEALLTRLDALDGGA
jgi:hypothetical protein